MFKPDAGGNMLLGAVGQLQFEVVQHRLKTEYDCDIRLEGCQYTGARWITADTPAELREFEGAYPLRPGARRNNTLAFFVPAPTTCVWRRSVSQNPLSPLARGMPGWSCRALEWRCVANCDAAACCLSQECPFSQQKGSDHGTATSCSFGVGIGVCQRLGVAACGLGRYGPGTRAHRSGRPPEKVV